MKEAMKRAVAYGLGLVFIFLLGVKAGRVDWTAARSLPWPPASEEMNP